MNNFQSKKCEICHDDLNPDYRIGDRQRVCSKLSCQQQRKRRSQKAWLKKNPDYYKGRYPQLKEKILARQKKVKTQRATGLSAELQPLKTIQDELISSNNNILTHLIAMLTIQDEITSKFIISNRHLHKLKAALYKTNEQTVFKGVNRLTIQDEIAFLLSNDYLQSLKSAKGENHDFKKTH